MKAPGVKLVKVNVTARNGTRHTYWQLRWPDTLGKTRTENIGKVGEMPERAAGELRRQKIADLDNGKALRDRSRITVAQYLDLDRESLAADHKPATITQHRTASTHLITAIGADVLVEKLAWPHVAALKRYLSEDRNVARATVTKTLATLKATFRRAVARELLAKNPLAIEKLGKVPSRQKRIFSVAEIELMVESATTAWWKAFIRLGFTTGLRLSELLNLTWSDIDRRRQQVIVSAKRAGTFTVGEIEYPILEWSPKTYHERHVPLCPEALAELEPMKLRGGGSPYVFLPADRLGRLARRKRLPESSQWVNNIPRDVRQIQERARALAAERAGVDLEKIEWPIGTVHDLRRSWATHLAPLIPMHDLMKLGGWSQITTVQTYYLDASRDVAEKVRAVFARSG